MIEYLIEIDKLLFYLINTSLSNNSLDIVMKVVTDWDKTILGRLLIITLLIILIWRGGKTGKIVVLLLIPTIIFTDQFNSSVLKNIFERPRPCHIFKGTTYLESIRLLVNCGSGFSFPSSHAANSFAVATIFTVFYKKYWWAFAIYGFMIAFSRIYVGVHFPFDVIAGALVGIICALMIYSFWLLLSCRFKKLSDRFE